MNHCIACGYSVVHPLFHPKDQPLAAFDLPKTAQDARALARYPLDFRVCARCGHIFNVAFEYAKVPYQNNSNLMYNAGSSWKEYMDLLAERVTAAYHKPKALWLEIGCGDGTFLDYIRAHKSDARVVGFEPGIEARNAEKRGIEAIEDYFVPRHDLPKYRPDVLICRHVIEHLEYPAGFVAELAYWCNVYQCFPVLIAEVPCMDKAIRNARINDYLYEHVSNFTTFSFKNMFEQAGFTVMHMEHGYADEVVVADVRPAQNSLLAEIQSVTETYRKRIDAQFQSVTETLSALKAQGKSLAFWGGTGKGASFLNNFNVLAEDYPVVIDSDYNKVGRFVPYTAQEIRPPEYLNENPADIIVITTQWRAKDIYAEIMRRKIPHQATYVLVNQQLVSYTGEVI